VYFFILKIYFVSYYQVEHINKNKQYNSKHNALCINKASAAYGKGSTNAAW